ncbi:MAG: serine/threonine protein kinase [Lentisphaeraceae bacterium]|nr:serine/threonine protein kinase [Lentisphaeraceae bacterium]
MSQDTKESSENIFETINPSLHQYFSLASEEIDTPQPIFDEIAANEKRYNQGVLINQGGMKKILQTTDILTDRPVAMATLLKPDDHQKAERFLREARLTATLEHPNIIPVYDIGLTENSDPFFTMKLIGGKSLSKILKELGEGTSKVSLQNLLDIFIKICDAISYAHSKGILHLDLKPSNIQIGEYGEVLVCDWGLAKVTDAPDETIDGELDPCFYNDITLDGVIKGTPGFMAPEQIDSKLGNKTKQTDIYALGGILYTLLTLRPPVKKDNVQEVLDATVAGDIPAPSELGLSLNIPISLEAVAMKALNKDSSKRYKSVILLRNDIHKWLGGFATSAENAGFLKSALLLLIRHKAVASLLLFIVSSLIVSMVIISHKEREATNALMLYEEEKRQTEIIGKEASPRLVYMAKQALNSFEYNKALQFIDQSIDRDSENQVAYALKGLIHFYRQEYIQSTDAFKLSGKHQKNYKKLISIATDLGKTKKDNNMLLSKDVIQLLKRFSSTNHIFKIYRYCVANYESLDDHMKTCFFMLKYHNPQNKKWNLNFTYTDEATYLDLSKNKHLAHTGCVRDIPIDHLDISNTVIWQTWMFEEMPLVELRMLNTKIQSIKEILKIPTLKKLYINKKKWPNAKPPKGSELKIIRI